MGQKNLPIGSGAQHVKAFEELGWTLVPSRRGRGKHFLLRKAGHRAVLSVPDHAEVKRALLASLLRDGNIDEAEYVRAYRKAT